MAWSYVARQPILATNRDVVGYELLFRDGEKNAFPSVSDEEGTSRLIVEQQFDGDIRDLVGSNAAFINFSRKSLIDEHPKFLPAKGVVVEVLETVEPDRQVIDVCEDLKACGYSLALDDHDFNPAWRPWFHLFDIIKIDITQFSRCELARHLSQRDFQSARLLAERVQTQTDFDDCQELGFSLFQGYFFAKPQMIRKQSMQTNRASTIRLLALVSNSTIDFDELEAVIALDPGLSFKLLRFLNSAYFSLGSRISNLRQALIFLGHKEIKKFVALVSLASLGDPSQNAAITLAATRANFCDALAKKIDDESIRHSAFLVGLFSMIDTLLEDSMENILNLFPVDDSIREALLNNQGIGAELLNLTKCFERAHWAGISAGSKRFGVSEEEIIACYQNAVQAASGLMPATAGQPDHH
jgi:EAL and modified HD-GYP domain-containing signal transduction protein